MNQIRIFIAIEIPSSIKEKISDFQEELKKEHARISWVKPDNIHITLKFLGNVTEDKIDAIGNAVEIAVAQIKSFQIEITNVGAFPNYEKPRVIWVGAQSESDLLKITAKQIDNELHQLGFELEKRSFKAHLTLGRVKGLHGIDGVINKLKQGQGFKGGSFKVHEIVVMRSDLKPTGAVYTSLKRITIKE